MGLIKAAFGAAGGILADQWKEFFSCEAIPADVLVMKGQKNTGRRSPNTKAPRFCPECGDPFDNGDIV